MTLVIISAEIPVYDSQSPSASSALRRCACTITGVARSGRIKTASRLVAQKYVFKNSSRDKQLSPALPTASRRGSSVVTRMAPITLS